MDLKEIKDLTTVGYRITQILVQALPACLSMFIFVMQMTVNLFFVGRLNDAALIAGVGMGNVIANIMCLSFVMGFNQALDTLISQAYGAGQIRLCGTILNRGRIISILVFIPILIMLSHTEEILLSFEQDP